MLLQRYTNNKPKGCRDCAWYGKTEVAMDYDALGYDEQDFSRCNRYLPRKLVKKDKVLI